MGYHFIFTRRQCCDTCAVYPQGRVSPDHAQHGTPRSLAVVNRPSCPLAGLHKPLAYRSSCGRVCISQFQSCKKEACQSMYTQFHGVTRLIDVSAVFDAGAKGADGLVAALLTPCSDLEQVHAGYWQRTCRICERIYPAL